jgi:hypothetical protein
MSLLLVSMLVLSPGPLEKQGGIPIVANPDTLVQSEESSFDLSSISGELTSIIGLQGGHFGVGIVDLESGQSVSRSEGGRFFIGLPNVITATCAMEFSEEGIFPMDSLVAWRETLEELLRRAQEGGLTASQSPFYDLGHERMLEWLAEKGFDDTEINGVQLTWEGAPEVDPNYTSVEDCLGMLSIVDGYMDVPSTRRITRNPQLGPALESEMPAGATVYGWVSTDDGHRALTLILYLADGRKYGMVVLADELCCPEKADLAFTMLLDAVTD